MLRNIGITTAVITGAVTSGCVEAAVGDAFDTTGGIWLVRLPLSLLLTAWLGVIGIWLAMIGDVVVRAMANVWPFAKATRLPVSSETRKRKGFTPTYTNQSSTNSSCVGSDSRRPPVSVTTTMSSIRTPNLPAR